MNSGEEHGCPSCDRIFTTRQGLGQHHSQSHGETLREYEGRQGKFACPYTNCERAFDSQMAVYGHFANVHEAGVEQPCQQCGEVYTRPPAIAEESRFCSVGCYNEFQAGVRGESHPLYSRVTLICSWCGSDFKEIPGRANRRTYCSKDCQGEAWKILWSGENHASWKGGPFPYGAGWNDEKKELVRERDKRQCRVCGKSEQEHLREHGTKHSVHHIANARVLQDAPDDLRNGPFNLVTICRDHHASWERVPSLLQFMAFLPHPSLPIEQATSSQSGKAES